MSAHGVCERVEENLTKQGSARGPVRPYAAKSDTDDGVHLVDAAPVDLVDPSPLRTRCGAAVLQVYNTTRDVTCAGCAERSPATAEPQSHVAASAQQ
jgi:hypothetical protein